MSTIQIADKPTLDEILTLLENTTYGLNALKTAISNSGVDLTPIANQLNNTTYGLSAIKTSTAATKTLLENTTYGLNAIKGYVDTLESVIGTTTNTGGTASAGTVMAKLNALFSLVSNTGGIPGTVKSVQRGTATGGESDNEDTITINTINPNKAIVILNASLTQHAASGQVYAPYVVSLTSTVLTVGNHRTAHDAAKYSWQVIEFY